MIKQAIYLVHGGTDVITSDTDWKKISTREQATLSDSVNKPHMNWVLPALPVGTGGVILGPGVVGTSRGKE